jgi:hypothetical protein
MVHMVKNFFGLFFGLRVIQLLIICFRPKNQWFKFFILGCSSLFKSKNELIFLRINFTIIYRLLLVLERQIKPPEQLILLLLLLPDFVEHNVELVTTPHIIQQLDRVRAQRVPQLQVLVLEILLLVGQDVELVAQLERGQDGIHARQRDVRLGGEALVGVQPRLRVPQRVELEFVQALGALAVEVVRLGNAIAVDQQDLHDLGAVVLRGEHDRSDVGRELSVVRARRLPERVRVAVEDLLLVQNLVLGML